MPKKDKVRLSAGASRRLNRLLALAEDNALSGGYYPTHRADVEAAYKKAVEDFRRWLSGLERIGLG